MSFEREIIDLDGALPAYLLVINRNGWGGTWCSACVFRVVEQEVPGHLMRIPIGQLGSMGIKIDPALLWRHDDRVVVIRESTERTCKSCDWKMLHVSSPDPNPAPTFCYNSCCGCY